MSGASALASARRRRAGTQEQIPGQANRSQKPQQQVQQQLQQVDENNENVQLTPLQILKLHDNKIKLLEQLIEDKFNSNENVGTSENLIQNVDESKIIENLSQKMEGLLSNKLNNINDTIKSILLNIEKLSNIATINEKNLNKTEDFFNELNALKMLVIKNQTLSLETNNDIIKIKEDLTNIKNDLNEENNSESLENTNNLLKSFFGNMASDGNMFSKINIDEDDDESITLKNIENLDTVHDENLENIIKKDIALELKENYINNENNKIYQEIKEIETVEISENE